MKQNNILCMITSPKETKRYINVQSITLPAYSGQAQVLAGHAETFLLLKKGNVVLRYPNRQTETLQITAGGCHITSDTVTIVL